MSTFNIPSLNSYSMRTLSAIAIGLLFSPVFAQFQVVHDVPNTTSTPQITPLILADGSVVTHHWDAGEHVFRKYNDVGELVWNRGFAGNNASLFGGWGPGDPIKLFPDVQNGFVFVRLASATYEMNDTIGLFGYTAVHTYHIGRVQADGTFSSNVMLSKTYLCFEPYPALNIDAAITPDNGIVLLSTIGISGIGTIDMIKMDPNGTMIWGRSVGTSVGLPDDPQPTYTFDTEPYGKVAVSATGRIYYTEGGRFSPNESRLAELDENGDMVWMKRYIYGNTSPEFGLHRVVVGPDGKVHAAGELVSTVGRFHIFQRTSPDGVLERVDQYRNTVSVRNGHFHIDDMGRRVHRVNTLDPLDGRVSQGILLADTLGSAAHFLRRDDQVILPNNVSILPWTTDVRNDHVAIGAVLVHEDVDLAYTTRYETVLDLTLDNFEACFMSDTLLAHIPVPLSIMTTENVSNAVSIDVSQFYSTETVTMSFTDLDPEPLDALCAFGSNLLGVEIGLSETAMERTPLVTQTLVQQGTPLLLNGNGPLTVDVFTARGNLVQSTQLIETNTLRTTGWTPGVYVIRSITDSRVARVVVE